MVRASPSNIKRYSCWSKDTTTAMLLNLSKQLLAVQVSDADLHRHRLHGVAMKTNAGNQSPSKSYLEGGLLSPARHSVIPDNVQLWLILKY